MTASPSSRQARPSRTRAIADQPAAPLPVQMPAQNVADHRVTGPPARIDHQHLAGGDGAHRVQHLRPKSGGVQRAVTARPDNAGCWPTGRKAGSPGRSGARASDPPPPPPECAASGPAGACGTGSASRGWRLTVIVSFLRQSVAQMASARRRTPSARRSGAFRVKLIRIAPGQALGVKDAAGRDADVMRQRLMQQPVGIKARIARPRPTNMPPAGTCQSSHSPDARPSPRKARRGAR